MSISRPRAEVIAIGDELTSGQRLDTNSQWLSQQLADLGIRVAFHTTVGDQMDDNVNVFANAFKRADVVVCTGGLGPTADDLTRDALAMTTGTELEMHEDLLDHIRKMFESRGREMPDRNRLQAMFPKGSHPIPNPHGTAPGIDLTWTRADGTSSRCFALPGVPVEMKDMWEATVKPELLTMEKLQGRCIVHRRLKCFGLGESEVERRLPDLIQRDRNPLVGITASKATITLRISADAPSETECHKLIEPTENIIREALGDIVFGTEDEEIEHAVARLLEANNMRMAVVELATLGTVSKWMSNLENASRFFAGGMRVQLPSGVASTEVDGLGENVLHVTLDEWASQFGVRLTKSNDQSVSEPSMSEKSMIEAADYVRSRFGCEVGLIVGNQVSPQSDVNEGDGATSSRRRNVDEVPHVPLAIVDPYGELHARHPIVGHPEILVPRAAKQGLDLIRRRLIKRGGKTDDGKI